MDTPPDPKKGSIIFGNKIVDNIKLTQLPDSVKDFRQAQPLKSDNSMTRTGQQQKAPEWHSVWAEFESQGVSQGACPSVSPGFSAVLCQKVPASAIDRT
ncbi:MAG: hypothetical protein ACK4NW_00835 [Roseinatronobacter sp.]